jgi:hypothetical protein
MKAGNLVKGDQRMTVQGKALVVTLVGLMLLVACQGIAAPGALIAQPTPVFTAGVVNISRAGELTGIWTLTSHPHYKLAYWLLRPDGTYTFSPSQDGGRPSESGRYWFEEDLFLIKDDFCPTPGKYTVMKQGEAENTALVIRVVEDGCPARVKILTTGPATRFGDLP